MSKRTSKPSTMLYGRNSILERLKHNPFSVRRIFLRDNLDLGQIVSMAKGARICVERVSAKKLSKIKPGGDAQGVVALIDPFVYHDLEDLLPPRDRLIIFLDHLYDPQNLGVILRTAACMIPAAVVIPKHDACQVTDSVVHVACGGENFVPVARVANLSQAVIKAKEQGYWIVGADHRAASSLASSRLLFPLGVVMGAEAAGIRPGLKKHLDQSLSIFMPCADLSLNVAIACSIFCFEAARRQKGEK